jgi:hypothetical protein
MDLRLHVNKIIEDQSQEKTGKLYFELICQLFQVN